jgi:prolipoprotein diacylglyceryl transferase
MFPIINVGPLAIQTPGLFLIAGIWIAMNAIEKEAPRRSLSTSDLSNLTLIALAAGVIGARIWYAVQFLDIYLANPLSLFSLNPATLTLGEGVLTGLLAGWIYGQRKGLPFWPTLDTLAPGLVVFGIALGLSHLASGNAFGAPSSVPWAIELWGDHRHPAQVYEILLAVLIFLAIRQVKKRDTFPGFTFLSWLAMAAGSRLFLEAFRGDSSYIFGGWRSAQLISLAVLVVAMLGLHFVGKSQGIEVMSDEE